MYLMERVGTLGLLEFPIVWCSELRGYFDGNIMAGEERILHGGAGRNKWLLAFYWHGSSSGDVSTHICFALFVFGMRRNIQMFLFSIFNHHEGASAGQEKK